MMMQQMLALKSQTLFFNNTHLPFEIKPISLSNHISSSTPFPWKLRSTSRLIVAARKQRKRIGWRRSGKSAIESALLIASKLNFFPEPLNLIIKEGLGGSGNGGGSWNRFGGWGGGFGGWNNKRKINLGFLKLVLGVCGSILLLIFWKEFEGLGDVGFGILGLILLGIIEKDWKRGVKGWMFGFCSCAFMVILGLKRKELHKCVNGFRVPSPIMNFVRRRKRWRRRVI